MSRLARIVLPVFLMALFSVAAQDAMAQTCPPANSTPGPYNQSLGPGCVVGGQLNATLSLAQCTQQGGAANGCYNPNSSPPGWQVPDQCPDGTWYCTGMPEMPDIMVVLMLLAGGGIFLTLHRKRLRLQAESR